jgi:hypothetical protein
VLRYAHEHGCPWDSRTCYEAANGEPWAPFAPQAQLEPYQKIAERACAKTSEEAGSGLYGHIFCLYYNAARGCATLRTTNRRAAGLFPENIQIARHETLKGGA